MTKQEYNQRYYLEHREKALAEAGAYRQANRKVIAEKAITAYYRTREHVLAQKREYTQRTRAHKKAYNHQYLVTNAAETKSRGKAYRKNNHSRVNEVNRHYAAQHPDKIKEWRKKWMVNNPDKILAQASKRRALQMNAVTDAAGARQFFSWIHNQDFVTCTYCGKYISGRSVSIDHIVPLSRGGAHEPDNFCVSCRSCNSSKHDQLLLEWKRCPERIRRIASFVETSKN